jgi:hypothetical protein
MGVTSVVPRRRTPTFMHPRGSSRSCAHVPPRFSLALTQQRLKLSLSVSHDAQPSATGGLLGLAVVRPTSTHSQYGGASSRYGSASLLAFPRSQAAAASQSICVCFFAFVRKWAMLAPSASSGSQAATASQVSCTLVSCSGLSTMFYTWQFLAATYMFCIIYHILYDSIIYHNIFLGFS